MWLVSSQSDDEEDIFINAFSSEEKAIAYRDATCKYATIREVMLDPEPPVELRAITLAWQPGKEIIQGSTYMRIGYGFESESHIEQTWRNHPDYCSQARTVERAKELLVKIIPDELKVKYFLDQ